MKTPSVFSVLSTCPGESSSPEPLHGFLTLSDSFGGSWIVGLTSHECVVLYMETWNELLTHAIYDKKETASLEEPTDADTPTVISKELLLRKLCGVCPQDMFTGVELDALRSSIESLNARLTRHLHYEQVDSSNRQKQMAGRRVSRIQDNELSQLKSSLEKLTD